jgi:hypothetical protein
MAIRKCFSGVQFSPDASQVMVTALERARTILNLDNPDDPLTEVLAKKVISLASQGCLDPAEIGRRVVADTDKPRG